MSKIRHDSPEAERLAMHWHGLGAVLNAASVFVSLMGVVWHIWAVSQHKRALKGKSTY